MASRYEREIEEIIQKRGDFLKGPQPPRVRPRSPRRGMRPHSKWSERASLTPGRLMLGSIGILLVAWLLWSSVPVLGRFLALGAVILFLVSYAFAFAARPAGGFEKRWRGERVQYEQGVPWSVQVKHWWRRLRR